MENVKEYIYLLMEEYGRRMDRISKEIALLEDVREAAEKDKRVAEYNKAAAAWTTANRIMSFIEKSTKNV